MRTPCLLTKSWPSDKKCRISARSESATTFSKCCPGLVITRPATMIRRPLRDPLRCCMSRRLFNWLFTGPESCSPCQHRAFEALPEPAAENIDAGRSWQFLEVYHVDKILAAPVKQS